MNASKNRTDCVATSNPWSDGVERTFTPRQVLAAMCGGFDVKLAEAVLADQHVLDFIKNYLKQYKKKTGHLPYSCKLGRYLLHNNSTPEDDASRRIAIAVGLNPFED